MPSLWQEAFDGLDGAEKIDLDFVNNAPHPSPSKVLKVVTDTRNECVKKQWVLYTNAHGEKVMVRDKLNKIVDWVNRFKEVGDAAVQYDPTHAALPWAVIRFFLQVRPTLLLSEA
jgi:hypothetical protein